ncbi:restriction endonuclease subunit S [Acidovorax sp. JMULE5]|uniref:restriction endonuclease subunit S n=1 Tax=Acidovorax sp. JMULE5 TaxID=2518343 RepID=UPI0015A2ACCD|nr:restriction endonuclease subunit S [Acidovorax sp. JMULE5]QLA79513.1 restriction endonuclease subunit S [Acidovorax sp. JMULE5]
MLLSNLDVLATAPGGVARLRELILTLAVQGKLVPQAPADEPASVLLQKIRAEKNRLLAEGKIKRDKPLAEIGEEEKPFGLPTQWEWVRLADLMPEFQNGASSRGDAGGTPITVLRLADIKGKRISLLDTRQVPIAPGDIAKYQLAEGDILITRVNGSADIVGQFNLCDRPVDAIYCDHFIRMRIDQRWIEPSFCALLGDSALVRTAIKSLFVTTAGQKTVNQGHIGSLQFPLPPLPEQSRIVARVEELMRLCDALQAKGQLEAAQHAQLVSTLLSTLTASTAPEELADNWQRVAQHFDLLLDRPEAIDALEQTLLQLAVRGLLTLHQRDELFTAQSRDCSRTQKEGPFAVPVDWEWCRLGEVAELINGDRGQNYPNKSEYVPAGVPFINTGHIDPDGSLSASRMHFLTRKKFDSLRSGKVRKGDLVYCLRGATLGKTAIVDYEEGAIASSLVIVRPSPKLDNQFLLLYLTSPAGRSFIWQHDNGSAQPNLAAGSLKKYWIPLPPLAEQSRVVTRVTALRRLCADLRQRLKAAQVTQSHLAQALVDSTSFV